MPILEGRVPTARGAGSLGDVLCRGKATAVRRARQGARVYATDIRQDAVEVTRSLIRQEGGHCLARACDMTQAAEVEDAVSDCLAKFGRIDILINNVGGSAPGDAESM